MASIPTSLSSSSSFDDISSSEQNGIADSKGSRELFVKASTSALLALIVAATGYFPGAALADEYGKETEAPTLFTGENVMICTKRGPLGACQKTELRTAENDNDKANKYFLDPSQKVQEKDLAMRESSDGVETDKSDLVAKLLQQTEDNRDRNDRLVKAKTLLNNQSASFGPFDRQVVILNEDGETFTLLENPQAMRLKNAGYIKDRKFVKQPSQEVIDAALESPDTFGEGVGGMFKGLMGGGGGE